MIITMFGRSFWLKRTIKRLLIGRRWLLLNFIWSIFCIFLLTFSFFCFLWWCFKYDTTFWWLSLVQILFLIARVLTWLRHFSLFCRRLILRNWNRDCWRIRLKTLFLLMFDSQLSSIWCNFLVTLIFNWSVRTFNFFR